MTLDRSTTPLLLGYSTTLLHFYTTNPPGGQPSTLLRHWIGVPHGVARGLRAVRDESSVRAQARLPTQAPAYPHAHAYARPSTRPRTPPPNAPAHPARTLTHARPLTRPPNAPTRAHPTHDTPPTRAPGAHNHPHTLPPTICRPPARSVVAKLANGGAMFRAEAAPIVREWVSTGWDGLQPYNATGETYMVRNAATLLLVYAGLWSLEHYLSVLYLTGALLPSPDAVPPFTSLFSGTPPFTPPRSCTPPFTTLLSSTPPSTPAHLPLIIR